MDHGEEMLELGHTFLFDHTNQPNFRVWSQGQTRTNEPEFHHLLEKALYESAANFQPTFNYHTYMLNFFLGFILTLPHNHLKRSFNIANIYVKYDQGGKLKIFTTAYVNQKLMLIYKYIDTTGEPFDPTISSLNDVEVAEIIRKLKPKYILVPAIDKFIGDQYFIRPKQLYKEGLENLPQDSPGVFKLEVLQKEEAIAEKFRFVRHQLVDLPESNEFVRVNKMKGVYKLDKLLNEIDIHNEDDVKLGVHSFLKRLMRVYQQNNLNEFSLDPVDICGFVHGAIMLGYKQRYFSDLTLLYHELDYIKMNFELNPKIWTSKSPVPAMIDFVGEHSLEMEEKRLKNVWDAKGQKVSFRTNSKNVVYMLLACGSNNFIIKSNIVKIHKPHGLVEALMDGAQKVSSKEMTIDRLQEIIQSELEDIQPVEKFYYRNNAKYLSRFLLGLLSGVKCNEKGNHLSSYLAKPIDEPDGDVMNPITIFVIGKPGMTSDIHINMVEMDQYNNDYDYLVHNTILVLDKSHAQVTDVIRINIKVGFDQNSNDFANPDEVKRKLNMEVDVNFEKSITPRESSSHYLQPITPVDTEAIWKSLDSQRKSVYGQISENLENFFISHQDYVNDVAQLKALVDGLFFTTPQKVVGKAAKLSLDGYYGHHAIKKAYKNEMDALSSTRQQQSVKEYKFHKFPVKPASVQVILISRPDENVQTKVNQKEKPTAKLVVFNFEFNSNSEIEQGESLQILKESYAYDKRTYNEEIVDRKYINFVISPNAAHEDFVNYAVLNSKPAVTQEQRRCVIMRRKRSKVNCIDYYEADSDQKLIRETSPEIESEHEIHNIPLLQQHEIHSHLQKLSKAASIGMYGLIAKDTLADLYNENWEGVAINVGFIGGSIVFGKVGEKLSATGTKLIKADSVLLGTSLKISSSFLSRGTSAFIAYDLYNSVRRYESGDKDAMADIIGDGTFLTIDTAEITIEVFEALGYMGMAELSAFTGPIGQIIGVCILVGAEIYKAEKTVEHIDSLIHLSKNEKFLEGLYAFSGIGPEPYIEHLMDEKAANNHFMEMAAKNLQSHKHIQRYISPTGCICDDDRNSLTVALHQYIDLRQKINDVQWSRASPDKHNGTSLFCMPIELDLDEERHVLIDKESTDESNPYHFRCANAFGIDDTINVKNQNITFLNLGDGDDTVYGFVDEPNIFSIGNGTKLVYGGNDKDIFIVHGNTTSGFIDGYLGYNILDLRNYALPSLLIIIYDTYAIYDSQSEEYEGHFIARNIHELIGRKDNSDQIAVNCDLVYLDLLGGNDQKFGYASLDLVVVPDHDCLFNLTMQIHGKMYVKNSAMYGRFNYVVSNLSGQALLFLHDNNESQHVVKFHYNLNDILGIRREYIDDIYTIEIFIGDYMHGHFGQFGVHGAHENFTFIFTRDNAVVTMSPSKEYAFISTNLSTQDIIDTYESVADHLSMLIVAYSTTDNISVAIGSSSKPYDLTNRHVSSTIIHNDPLHASHLVGGNAPNVFNIMMAGGNNEIHIPDIIIYRHIKSEYNDTINFSALKQQVMKQCPYCEFIHDIKVDKNDIVVTLLLLNTSKLSNESAQISKVSIKNALNDEAYKKFSIVINVPMKIKIDQLILNDTQFNESSTMVFLLPVPLVFPSNFNIIVINDSDIDENQMVIIHNNLGSYKYYRYNDSLVISNIKQYQHGQHGETKLISLMLTEFFRSRKMIMMTIQFNDTIIAVKDKFQRYR